ncbi:MAG: hypothetical protein WBD78_10660 [Methylocella sp.]
MAIRHYPFSMLSWPNRRKPHNRRARHRGRAPPPDPLDALEVDDHAYQSDRFHHRPALHRPNIHLPQLRDDLFRLAPFPAHFKSSFGFKSHPSGTIPF